MNLGSKWIEGIRPDGGVPEAATLSLSARLAAVGHWLPLAASHADKDIEYVHQLRVSTRRATAALRIFREWLPPKKCRWLKKRLQQIRRAAGAARDFDVLTLRLADAFGDGGSPLLAEIAARRAAVQPAICEISERLLHDGLLARKVHKLLDGIGERGDQAGADRRPTNFRAWAEQRLGLVAGEFFDAMPADSADTAALHQFRIRAKALRYAIELLAPAFGPELRREHYRVVEEAQERLGKVNDCVVGARHWCELSAAAADANLCRALEQLAERDRNHLAQELEAFRQWWNPERVEILRRGLLPI
jgi:CHAD domain-containing protein